MVSRNSKSKLKILTEFVKVPGTFVLQGEQTPVPVKPISAPVSVSLSSRLGMSPSFEQLELAVEQAWRLMPEVRDANAYAYDNVPRRGKHVALGAVLIYTVQFYKFSIQNDLTPTEPGQKTQIVY